MLGLMCRCDCYQTDVIKRLQYGYFHSVALLFSELLGISLRRGRAGREPWKSAPETHPEWNWCGKVLRGNAASVLQIVRFTVGFIQNWIKNVREGVVRLVMFLGFWQHLFCQHSGTGSAVREEEKPSSQICVYPLRTIICWLKPGLNCLILPGF